MTSQPPGPQKGTALYTNHINAIERSPLGPPHLNVDIDVMIDSPINIHLGSTLETGVRGCRGCEGCLMESWVGRYLSVDRRGRSMTLALIRYLSLGSLCQRAHSVSALFGVLEINFSKSY